MKTTADYLDALRARFNVPSDYGLQTATGWHRQQISRYRTKRGTFDDETAQRVAAWLEKPLAEVLIDMNAQRAKRPEVKKAWQRAATALSAGATALFLLVFFVGGLPVDGLELAFLIPAGFTHYTVIRVPCLDLKVFFSGLFQTLIPRHRPCAAQPQYPHVPGQRHCPARNARTETHT